MSGPSLPGYDNLELIGKGGFSRVYRADQSKLKRKVAVKVLNFGLNDQGDRKSFERETELMGRVSTHPNIVTVHDTAFSSEGQPCIVMELYPGGSLADLINEVGRLETREALEVGVAIGSALEASHLSGVLHCDLKPQNILISEFGQPALGDFGISTFSEERTRTGNEVGAGFTLPYAAPEIVEGASPTVETDVYSLAATLYTALCGRRPFAYPTAENAKPSAAEHARRILLEPARPLLDHGVPAEVDALIRQAMSKDPAVRPQSAAEFAANLHQAGQRLGFGTSQPRIADHGALRTVDAESVGSGRLDLTQLVRDRQAQDLVDSIDSRQTDRTPRVEHTPRVDGFGWEDGREVSDSRRRLAVIGAVAAIVLVATLLFVMSRGGAESAANDTVIPTSVPTVVGANPALPPPEPDNVQIQRTEDHSVVVSWDVPPADLAAGDVTFEVRRQDAQREPIITREVSALLPAVADDEAICVTVLAIRGVRASPPSEPVCSSAGNPGVVILPRSCVAPCDAVLSLVDVDPGGRYEVEVLDRSLGSMGGIMFTFDEAMTVATDVAQAEITIEEGAPAGDYLVRVTFPDGTAQTTLFTVEPAV